jgi:hypothetical protein
MNHGISISIIAIILSGVSLATPRKRYGVKVPNLNLLFKKRTKELKLSITILIKRFSMMFKSVIPISNFKEYSFFKVVK